MKFADLHLHTTYSDGTYTPEQLISEANSAGLSAISVVDHDTIEGIDLTIEAALKEGIEVVPGIELSAEYENIEIHILGYLIDYKNKDLLARLSVLERIRVDRIYKIVDKLKALGLNLNPETVFEIAGKGTVGRLHIARAMVKDGIVNSTFEVFHKYLGDKCPANVLGFKFSPQEAIKLIRDSGGISVLAHPYTLKNDELIPKFVEYGLMGLEVYYPEHSQGTINFYLGLCEKYNLLVTGGSDCHGIAKPEVRIGSIKLPYELVEKLKKAKADLK